MAIYRENEDLINIGAYTRGSNPQIDKAIQMRPMIEALLSQGQRELVPWDKSREDVLKLASAAAAAVPAANPAQASQAMSRAA